MPRASKAQTELNHAEIKRVSSQLIREHGLGVSVADVMGAAGLTHGGFYKHFESKDDMAAVACTSAFLEAVEAWKKRADGASDVRSALIKAYFKPSNRASAGHGCPMAALAMDVSRCEQTKPVREAYREGLEQLINILSNAQLSDEEPPARRERALVDISTMVGSLVLAWATSGKGISNEIIAAARCKLLGESSA
ncbi:TetR/AcrR family transcriptional regulator [Paraburkholderia sp. BCC1885]|uniref:TetR/AcrR family transcriptional regulator n=1 Tax=Paraburkholderia sp. BCC1885 TaxID=2562669 RepID=UPI001183BA61|nr:TetR/AcrR family transcriptional regulator [Paraburkholderia sp. BCC1885]